MWGPMKNIPVLFQPTEPPKNKIFVFLFLDGCVYYQTFAFPFSSMYVCVFEKLCFTRKTRALKNLLSLPIIEELKYRTNIFWKFPQRQSLFLKFGSQYFINLQLTANKIITCYIINIKKNLQSESELPRTFAEKGLKPMSNMESEVPWTLIPLIYSWSPNLMKRVEGKRGSS